MIHYRSVADLTRAVREGIGLLPRDIDLIVGIPRSGLLAASLVALYKNLPFTDLDGFLAGRCFAAGWRLKLIKESCSSQHVLVVDDSISTGRELNAARSQINNSPVKDTCKITYMAIYCAPEARNMVDVFVEEVPKCRVFEWNLFHSIHLSNACVDIDGVLCRDPLPSENDDGPEYAKFLKDASPNILPTVRISTLVSARLEKYRKETEEWLARHGVVYDDLILLDGVTAKQRRDMNLHAKIKAKVYSGSCSRLFVESSRRQAIEIAQIARKPVISVEDMVLYNGSPVSVSHYVSGVPARFLGLAKKKYWRLIRKH